MQSYQRRPSATPQYTAPVPVQLLRAQPVQPPQLEMAAVGGGTELPARLLTPNALQSEDPVVRAEARIALIGMTRVLDTVAERKRNVDAVMAELLRETRLLRTQRRQQRQRRILYVVAIIAFVLLTRGHFGFYWWFWMLGGGAVASDSAVGKRRQATHTLSQSDEPRTVGVLALAMTEEDSFMQDAARGALCRLLPRVRASDASYIDAEQMTALLALADSGDPAMQVPLLKALEQIGDERAMHIVQNLTVYGTPEVRQAAVECLSFLHERSQRAREQAELLRGVSGPVSAIQTDQLLRPAIGSQADVAPEQLLRATNAPVE